MTSTWVRKKSSIPEFAKALPDAEAQGGHPQAEFFWEAECWHSSVNQPAAICPPFVASCPCSAAFGPCDRFGYLILHVAMVVLFRVCFAVCWRCCYCFCWCWREWWRGEWCCWRCCCCSCRSCSCSCCSCYCSCSCSCHDSCCCLLLLVVVCSISCLGHTSNFRNPQSLEAMEKMQVWHSARKGLSFLPEHFSHRNCVAEKRAGAWNAKALNFENMPPIFSCRQDLARAFLAKGRMTQSVSSHLDIMPWVFSPGARAGTRQTAPQKHVRMPQKKASHPLAQKKQSLGETQGRSSDAVVSCLVTVHLFESQLGCRPGLQLLPCPPRNEHCCRRALFIDMLWQRNKFNELIVYSL